MSRIEIQTGTDQCLAYEIDGVAVFTLNRPQARNALTREMLAGLESGLDYAERSSSVRAPPRSRPRAWPPRSITNARRPVNGSPTCRRPRRS